MFFFGIIPKSKFNIYTTDLRVILSIIVATCVYAILLKFLQKNSPHNVQTKGGGGVKGLLKNVKKKLHFPLMMASLIPFQKLYALLLRISNCCESLAFWRNFFTSKIAVS